MCIFCELNVNIQYKVSRKKYFKAAAVNMYFNKKIDRYVEVLLPFFLKWETFLI